MIMSISLCYLCADCYAVLDLRLREQWCVVADQCWAALLLALHAGAASCDKICSDRRLLCRIHELNCSCGSSEPASSSSLGHPFLSLCLGSTICCHKGLKQLSLTCMHAYLTRMCGQKEAHRHVPCPQMFAFNPSHVQ
jgi:hypothetical protein